MALRNSVIADVWNHIEMSPFSPTDFQVVTDSRESLLNITFRHNSIYTFSLKKISSDTYIITASPGKHETQENTHIKNPSEAPEQVLNWAKNIRDELRTTIPIYSELDKLRETIEQHVKEHIDNPQEPFNQEESEQLRNKLDDLMAQFVLMQERHELTQQEVNRLNQEISNIKSNLNGYPKGTWYKTAASKLWLATSKVGTSKESRQVLAKAAHKLLGLDE